MIFCSYGCGQKATVKFKNGKWCCNKNVNSCPAFRNVLSKSHQKRVISFENTLNFIIEKDYYLLTTKDEYYNTKLSKMKFKCSKNHEFFMRIDCFKSGQRCPVCSRENTNRKNKERMVNGGGRKQGDLLRTPFNNIINFVTNEGYDLISTATEYKNIYSYLKFKCPNGHIFKKRYDGFVAGYRCKKCDNERRRKMMLNGGAAYLLSFVKNPSKPQLELFTLVKSLYPTSVLNYPSLNFSIDVAIPDLKIAIEYDSVYWHQNKDYDRKRQKKLEKQGWKFLRYEEYIPNINNLKEDIENIINP